MIYMRMHLFDLVILSMGDLKVDSDMMGVYELKGVLVIKGECHYLLESLRINVEKNYWWWS
jgi:hypothetical protein